MTQGTQTGLCDNLDGLGWEEGRRLQREETYVDLC